MSDNIVEKSATWDPAVIRQIRLFVAATAKADMKWYSKSTWKYSLAHRALGVLIIALSTSLPLITSLAFSKKDLVISFIGVLIAFLSGVNAFFRAGDLWKTNMRGMVELKNQLALWELRMMEAEHTPQAGMKIAVEATKELLDTLKAVDNKNAEDYVNTINFPSKQP